MKKLKPTIQISKEIISSPNNLINFKSYLKDIANLRPLSKEQEQEIFKQIQEGNNSLKELLIKHNLLFVVSCAKQYQSAINRSSLTLEDLISAGNVGLIEATNKFDYTSGNKFISYAVWWIKQQIMTCIKANIKNIRIPENRQSIYFKLKKIEEYYYQKNDGFIYFDEIKNDCLTKNIVNVSNNDIDKLFAYAEDMERDTSLFNTTSVDNDLLIIDVIPDNNTDLPDSMINSKDFNKHVHDMLNILSSQNKKIIELYHGIGHEKTLNFKEIGEIFECSGEQIRTQYNYSIKILRKKNKNNEKYFINA